MEKLAKKKCVPCKGGTPPLPKEERTNLLKELAHNWEVMDGHHLHKEYAFKNFVEALDFTNKVGEIAEQQGHHPNICLTWGKVGVTIFTHKIDGLTESDFVLAAKIENLYQK